MDPVTGFELSIGDEIGLMKFFSIIEKTNQKV